jgi:hypothetical protein
MERFATFTVNYRSSTSEVTDMPEVAPNVILRMGSHAEKEYIEKTLKYFDGLMVGANLLEASPGATASLLFKLCGATKRPYFLDPMTYAFGSYVDPETEIARNDLDWIKSDQKIRGGKKGETKRDFKRSYRKLAEAFGKPFSAALARGKAISLGDFPDKKSLADACERILIYQEDSLRKVFREDPDTRTFANDMPPPHALLAPYFYIEPSRVAQWIELNRLLTCGAMNLTTKIPKHAVVCGHRELLTNKEQAEVIIANLLACRPAGAWLWFSRFDEHTASAKELTALRWWVERLSAEIPVFNMHGGFFSMALSKFGLAGVAHGIGYGEQKDVVPVIGQSTPTVQYYVQPLHGKFSVPQITRCFSALGVRSPEEFIAKICHCAICKGIVGQNLAEFSQFGEIHYSTPTSQRAAQTPAAAKRCRFHFLLNRIQERDYLKNASAADIVSETRANADAWAKTFLSGPVGYLRTWAHVLSSKQHSADQQD